MKITGYVYIVGMCVLLLLLFLPAIGAHVADFTDPGLDHIPALNGSITRLFMDGNNLVRINSDSFVNATGLGVSYPQHPGPSASYVHDDVIKWKHFPRYWSFVRGIHRSPVYSPHKGQWRGALMFSLICALKRRLSKQSWGWWFEAPSRSLCRHCNAGQIRYFRDNVITCQRLPHYWSFVTESLHQRAVM